MIRRISAFNELKDRGYEITSFELLVGGINSSVFSVTCSNQSKYVLKLYPMPSSDDPRNRCQAEIDFLGYLELCDVTSCPKILEFNLENSWSLTSWIDGDKPNSLDTMELHQIINFIDRINRPELNMLRMKLNPASDAFQSMHSFANSVMHRIYSFYSLDTSTGFLVIRSLDRTTIEPLLVDLTRDILTPSCRSKIINSSGTMIASPSDFGIHNMLKKAKALFLDFNMLV